MTDEQVHKLSSKLKELATAEEAVATAEAALNAAKATRDKKATGVQKIRDEAGVPTPDATDAKPAKAGQPGKPTVTLDAPANPTK